MIRSLAGKADLPILAMTANIFKEDRQACMDAGMNDFVAKPFDLENLFSAILRWLPAGETTAEKTSSSASDDSDVSISIESNNDIILREKLAAIEGLDSQFGLRNMRGDVAAYLRLLRQFDTTHGDDIQELAKQLAKGAHEEALRIAHTIKGVAGTLGLKKLQEAAGVLEDNLRSHDGKEDIDEVFPLMTAVSVLQNSFHSALTLIANQLGAATTVAPDLVAAHKVIAHLILLLEKDDTAVNEFFLESELLLKSSFGAAAEQLQKQIEAFDYPSALIIAKSLFV